MISPKDSGYYFPAEWRPHEATWLTFPAHAASFPGILKEATKTFMEFVRQISRSEIVRINVQDEKNRLRVLNLLAEYSVDRKRTELYVHPSDDVWCRDNGPAFLINPEAAHEVRKIMVNWEFNAWGGKYPYASDNNIPLLMAGKLGYKICHPGIVMEGGSVEFNGKGTLITTRSCLLNKNRNPKLSAPEIEWYLMHYYGVERILWLGEGIAGDDTDGHVDHICRFVSEDTVVAMVETDKCDANYGPLRENLKILKRFTLQNGQKLNIVELPLPDAIHFSGKRFPASYANFYITNDSVIVPVFNCRNDQFVLDIFKPLFPGREIIGIDSNPLLYGYGSFHCLSQQEPSV